MKKNNTILIVDDESDIIDLLSYNLNKEGYNIVSANNGLEATKLLSSKIDLIVLDIMMPEMDGLEFCKFVKSEKSYSNIPIIFLTAKDSEVDEIIGLEMGADDYIYKPISIHRLKARIKVALRKLKKSPEQQKSLVYNNLEIDYLNQRVTISKKLISLTKIQIQILFMLSSSPNKIFTREEILDKVWDEDVIVSDRTIDTHIVSIRTKLQNYSKLIETSHGIGYSFSPCNLNEAK